MRPLVSTLAAGAAVATVVGCPPPVDGRAIAGTKDVDQAFFFTGDVSVDGQRVGADDATLLGYLPALRRIDVCGLLTGDTLNRVGETLSVGNTFRVQRV